MSANSFCYSNKIGNCTSCGHYAAKHENLGRQNEDPRIKFHISTTGISLRHPSPFAMRTSKQIRTELDSIKSEKRSMSNSAELDTSTGENRERSNSEVIKTSDSGASPLLSSKSYMIPSPTNLNNSSASAKSSPGSNRDSPVLSPRARFEISQLNEKIIQDKNKKASDFAQPNKKRIEVTDSDNGLLGLIPKLLQRGAQWVVDAKDLKFTSKLGMGTHAKVYKGLYRGQEVALKVPKIPEGKIAEDFIKEFEVLSSVRSQYVVYFYGVVFSPKFCVIMEYCPKGTLQDVLKNSHETFGWERFLKIAIDATRGIVDLHNWNPQIVHRDIKSLNLLIDEYDKCKLSDFGLARFLQANEQPSLSKVCSFCFLSFCFLSFCF